MYQQQQFHTAGYRGNQPGHDQYLRADSMQPSGSQVTSQYKGLQNRFQPTGTVQSFYNPEQQNMNMQAQLRQQQFRPVGQPSISPNAFHMASYRGNQPGHDQYLRADSVRPTAVQSQFQQSAIRQSSYSQQSGSSFSQPMTSVTSFHGPNYRGNQPGHDQYLRADSVQPSQMHAGQYRI